MKCGLWKAKCGSRESNDFVTFSGDVNVGGIGNFLLRIAVSGCSFDDSSCCAFPFCVAAIDGDDDDGGGCGGCCCCSLGVMFSLHFGIVL